MTFLILVRHGHTDTAGKRLTGWQRGVHLNEQGRRQADALVERLEGVPVRAIYSSPLERCRETASPLARARGLPVSARRGLIETGYGEWTGRSIAQARRSKLWAVLQRSPSAVRFPGGESLLEVQGRAVTELDRIAGEHRDDVVVVVTHADVVRLAVAHYAGMHIDRFERLVADPASISVVAVGGGNPRVVKLNETGDLGPPMRRPRPRSKLRG